MGMMVDVWIRRWVRFHVFKFRNGRPGGAWGINLIDWRWSDYFGWDSFQPYLIINLGRVGASIGWSLGPAYAPNGRSDYYRYLEIEAYTFPPRGPREG